MRERMAEMEKRILWNERDMKKTNIVATGIDFSTPADGYKNLQRAIDKVAEASVRISGICTITAPSGQKVIASCNSMTDKALIMR